MDGRDPIDQPCGADGAWSSGKGVALKRDPLVVIAGDFSNFSTGRSLGDGLRALGWAVQEVASAYAGGPFGFSGPGRVAGRLLARTVAENYRARIMRACTMLRPDVFITVKGVDVSADTLRQVRALGAKTVMFYPDVDFLHTGVDLDSFPLYDLFVSTKSFHADYIGELIGKERFALIPHGYVDGLHRPVFGEVSEADYRNSLLFCGSWSEYKQTWLNDLLGLDNGLDLTVVGSFWGRRSVGTPVASRPLPGEIPGIGYVETIQRAKINIAIHHGPTRMGWQDLVSTRTFELPACKGFMLHIDNDEIRSFFDVGTEIDVFGSPQELLDKARFYLDRPDLRQKMIEKAYNRCVPAYGYRQRAVQLNDLMSRTVLGTS